MALDHREQDHEPEIPQPDVSPCGLENLPYDVKYLILESIPDYETLTKFSQSSRDFYEIFRTNRVALRQRLLFNEASEYREESYLLACVGDKLTDGSMTLAELDSLYKCYADSLSRDAFERPWYYSDVLRGGAKMRAKIAEGHRGIKEHCERFIKREMRPRNIVVRIEYDEKPATDSERHRVIQALYKIWLLLKLHHARASDSTELAAISHGVGPLNQLRVDVARYLKLWDFWDLKVVQVILPIFWNDVKARYDGREDNRIRDALCQHERGCRDDYMAHFSLFLNTTLNIYYPQAGLKWLNGYSNIRENRKHIEDVVEYLSDVQRRAHAETLGDFTGIAYIYFQQIYGSSPSRSGFPGPEAFDSIPLKRLCRPGRATEEYRNQGIEGKRYFLKNLNHASTPQVDFQSCMWDDWRLKSWGYIVPEFWHPVDGFNDLTIGDTEETFP